MPSKFRRFAKNFLVFFNVVIALMFLFACLAPYLNPQKWWLISFLGLGFGFLFAMMILLFFLWLVIVPRYSLISAIPLLIGWKSISVFFAFNVPRKFQYEKTPGELRIVSWNVARLRTREKAMKLLKQQNADILCLQEFEEPTNLYGHDNISYIQKSLNYPYFYFSYDKDVIGQYYGSIIFSRFPIIDTGVVHYPRPTITEGLIHADIKYNQDTIRVYTTHLQSALFQRSDYKKMHEIDNVEDSIFENTKSIVSKLRMGFVYRSIQADIVKQLLADCPYPILFCADLNDVPNSFTYFTIRGDMQDAFLKKGLGIDRTFSRLPPKLPLRIDYIFASNDFSIQQYNRVVKNYSDHYMLLADVKLKK